MSARWMMGAALAALMAVAGMARAQTPLGTAFTYQGQLKSGGAPVEGACDFQFSLWDAATGGTPVGTMVSVDDHPVTGGLFTVSLDFGAAAFLGDARWLEIAVRDGASTGGYTTLAPRQPVTATPHALYALRSLFAFRAEHASWAGLTGIPDGFLDGIDDDTTYSAGEGLQLVGTQFSVDFDGTGAAATASRSDHDHDARYYTQAQLHTSGGGGQVHWDNLSGVPNGFGDGVDDDTLAGLSAAAGQVAKWDGAQWVASDDDDTTYSAGEGLLLAGTEFSVSFGGTGGAPWVARSDHDHFADAWTGSSGASGLSVTNSSTIYGAKAIYARASGAFGWTQGVYGRSDSDAGYGVYGSATATSGETCGVYGQTLSAEGRGVYGRATDDEGFTHGVYGESDSIFGCGVAGLATATTGGWPGGACGVYGRSASPTGFGVHGWAMADSGTTYGVSGRVESPDGWAGYFSGGKGLYANRIVVGTTNPESDAELYVDGDLEVTGHKGFVQQHPNDPAKQIVYVCLEGPEAGTYVRGTAELRDGEARVDLPEHFALVTNAEGLSVQLTPVGAWLQLYVVERTSGRIVVREASGRDGRFDYLVQGVRKGYEDHQVIREHTQHAEPPRDLNAKRQDR